MQAPGCGCAQVGHGAAAAAAVAHEMMDRAMCQAVGQASDRVGILRSLRLPLLAERVQAGELATTSAAVLGGLRKLWLDVTKAADAMRGRAEEMKRLGMDPSTAMAAARCEDEMALLSAVAFGLLGAFSGWWREFAAHFDQASPDDTPLLRTALYQFGLGRRPEAAARLVLEARGLVPPANLAEEAPL